MISEKMKQKRRELLHHLLDHGWNVNYEWIESECKKYGEDSSDLDKLILGRFQNDFHLISPDGTYTIRIKDRRVVFWQKEPTWNELASWPIGKVELIDRGVRWKIIEISIL